MQKSLKPRALIFDMDGLLIDSERIVKRSWDMAGKDLGYEKFGNHIVNTLGMNRQRRREYFFKAAGPDFPMDLFEDLTKKYFWEIAENEGIPLKKGARELLSYAKEHGYKIGLATSSSSMYAEKVLNDHKILNFFDARIYGNMITHSKPDPEIYLRAAEALGLDPSECIGIEDAANGVRAVCAAGMRAVLIPDLAVPSEEILSMVYRTYESLDQVIEVLMEYR